MINDYNLVGGIRTPLKNLSQLGLLSPIYGQIKFMIQTTSQRNSESASRNNEH